MTNILEWTLNRDTTQYDLNTYEGLCREWLKGCTCAYEGNPMECKDCTDGFLGAVIKLEEESK